MTTIHVIDVVRRTTMPDLKRQSATTVVNMDTLKQLAEVVKSQIVLNQEETNVNHTNVKGKLKWNNNGEESDSHSSQSSQSSQSSSDHVSMWNSTSSPITTDMLINGKKVIMEVDAGAAVSIIGERKLKALFPDVKVRKSDILLKTYTSEPIEVIEEIEVEVHYQQQTQKLVLVVVAEEGPVLLGRNWLKHVILDWALIGRINSKQISKMEILLKKYPDVFIGSSYCEIIR